MANRALDYIFSRGREGKMEISAYVLVMKESIQCVVAAVETETSEGSIEVSIVLQCLNERETVGICVSK